MDGVEACYSYAGILGTNPEGQTLKRLWRMAAGKLRQRRFELVELATLVWSMGDLDVERYLLYGEMDQTGKGGPVQLSPDVQAKVDAEIERIQIECPDLPKFRGT